MTAIVPGIYAQGKIELLETPVGIRDGKVRVIVIEDAETKPTPSQIEYGKYCSGTLSTEDDIAIAQWHGEKERPFERRGCGRVIEEMF
jgi:hypothetical protein